MQPERWRWLKLLLKVSRVLASLKRRTPKVWFGDSCWGRWPGCTWGNTTNELIHLRDHHPQLHVKAKWANWNLSQDKLVFTTTDNGSNFISAFDLLELPRPSCFGHNLDLAINKALQVNRVQQAIGRCYTLVGRFSRSWKKNRDLRQK